MNQEDDLEEYFLFFQEAFDEELIKEQQKELEKLIENVA